MAMNFEQVMSICRGCLATNIKMVSAIQYDAEFKDLTGITTSIVHLSSGGYECLKQNIRHMELLISPSDGLPQWLCYECAALLQKSVRFRKKVLNSHQTLTQYAMYRTPITAKSRDTVEVSADMRTSYSIDRVKQEPTLCIDESGVTEDKCREENLRIDDVRKSSTCELAETKTKNICLATLNCNKQSAQQQSKEQVRSVVNDIRVKVEIKNEPPCSGYDDDITIEELSIEKQIELSKQQTQREKVSSQSVRAPAHAAHRCEYADISSKPRQQDDGEDVKVNGSDSVNVNSCNNVKLYICDACSKRFNKKSLLIAHIRGHSKQKPSDKLYRCNVCNTHTFVTKEEKPYKCDVCMKCFKHKGDYDKHKVIHTGQKPYKCEICPKSFNRKGNRNIHMRNIHTGERPYKCDVCAKAYKTKFALKKHNLKHLGGEPYKCEV